jgi:hypothetical protein
MTGSPISKELKTQVLVFIAAIMLLALLSISVYTKDIMSANAAKSWPTVEGTVIFSESARGCGNGTSFWPKVQYRYGVAGQTYTSENLVFGNIGCGPDDAAHSIVQQFPLHANVVVHVSPDDPGKSVLMVGQVLDDTWLGIYVLSGIFGSCALFGLFVMRRY